MHHERHSIVGSDGAIKIDERHRGIIRIGVVVENAVSSGDAATAGGDAHVVSVKLGIVGGDGRDNHAGQGGTASRVPVTADLSLGDSCQRGVGCVEGGGRAQHQLVGITHGIGAVGKAGSGVVVKADRRGHLYLDL